MRETMPLQMACGADPEESMEVVSVNVGLAREIEWNGKSFRTAIVKEPVEGRRRVGRLNVDGDAQADLKHHGGPEQAVYAWDPGGHLGVHRPDEFFFAD